MSYSNFSSLQVIDDFLEGLQQRLDDTDRYFKKMSTKECFLSFLHSKTSYWKFRESGVFQKQEF